jgi:hypothetical protein
MIDRETKTLIIVILLIILAIIAVLFYMFDEGRAAEPYPYPPEPIEECDFEDWFLLEHFTTPFSKYCNGIGEYRLWGCSKAPDDDAYLYFCGTCLYKLFAPIVMEQSPRISVATPSPTPRATPRPAPTMIP